MNNLFSFWLAPVTALFHPVVYHDASKSSGGRGVLYTLYITCITVVVIMVFVFVVLMPKANELLDWGKTNMPVMIWTPEGLNLENGQTNYVMEYPNYGPVAIFDMTKTGVTEQDMGKAFIFVTKTQVFVKKEPGRLEARDITQAGIQSKQQLPAKVRITKELVEKLFQNIKGAIFFIVPMVILITLFIFNIVNNLFYSLVGLLLNLGRMNKLNYGAIFNLTCFAMTASWFVMGIMRLPVFHRFPWPWWAGVLMNLAYMYFAFKITDQESDDGWLPGPQQQA
ncbi:MAG TPA: DUF1189 family protein [Candidatus Omnitrophota bacterium]|nr:DUF1189 family protein [Candidatus Omnitrophota bacterium]